MRRRMIVIIPAALIGIVVFIFLGGTIVRLLWNGLLPPLFGWREITFWQALGMLILCRLLVGGVGYRGGYRANPDIRRRMADRVADRFADRWTTMTDEERERFRQRIRERCGFDPAVRDTKS